MRSVMSRAPVSDTVGSPSRSSTRATNPAAWWHAGQSGTTSTTSAPPALAASAICGAISVTSSFSFLMAPKQLRWYSVTPPMNPSAASSARRS